MSREWLHVDVLLRGDTRAGVQEERGAQGAPLTYSSALLRSGNMKKIKRRSRLERESARIQVFYGGKKSFLINTYTESPHSVNQRSQSILSRWF